MGVGGGSNLQKWDLYANFFGARSVLVFRDNSLFLFDDSLPHIACVPEKQAGRACTRKKDSQSGPRDR